MKHLQNTKRFYKTFYLSISIPLLLFFIISCSSSEPNLKVAGFKFNYEGNDYFIRSIYCEDNIQSCNHLIGSDFQALDSNQDRIIDEITRGDIDKAEAQKIYDYSLDLLASENKLNEVRDPNEEPKFTIENPNIIFEITSFHKEGKEPYNQFKIIENRINVNDEISVFSDKLANGSLDEKLQGDYMLHEAQKLYEDIIQEGLNAKKISKINDVIKVLQ